MTESSILSLVDFCREAFGFGPLGKITLLLTSSIIAGFDAREFEILPSHPYFNFTCLVLCNGALLGLDRFFLRQKASRETTSGSTRIVNSSTFF